VTLLNKPIRRELPGTFDRRQWLIELQPWGINFRAKRTRRTYPITWAAIWDKSQKIAAEQLRLERKQKRSKRNVE
jgi:hypothetical protein